MSFHKFCFEQEKSISISLTIEEALNIVLYIDSTIYEKFGYEDKVEDKEFYIIEKTRNKIRKKLQKLGYLNI